ncbi:MAG: hypothetical protein Q4B14_01780, partial [Clostridia bacterium]|nr:hypothetical protein [Clostridia bacterium]
DDDYDTDDDDDGYTPVVPDNPEKINTLEKNERDDAVDDLEKTVNKEMDELDKEFEEWLAQVSKEADEAYQKALEIINSDDIDDSDYSDEEFVEDMDKLLDEMRANNEITEEEYQEMKLALVDPEDPENPDFKSKVAILEAVGKESNAEGEKTESLFDKARKKIAESEAEMFVKINGQIGGYLEFSYASGGLEFTSGVIIAGLKLGVPVKTYIPPTPIYVGMSLSIGMNGVIGLEYDREALEKKLRLKAELSPSISAGAKVGLGAEKIIGVEGGFDGKLGTKINFTAKEKLKVNVSGSAYAKAYFTLFSVKKTWPLFDKQLYPRPNNGVVISSEEETFQDFLNTATLIDRSYLNNDDAGISALSNYLFEKNSTHPVTAPSLAVLEDGRKLLVWVDDTGTKSNTNMRSLMFSICDTNGTWSEAQALFEDGTDFDTPELHSDGGEIYLSYGKANQVMADDIAPEELLANYDLYVSKFNGTSFDAPVCVDGGDGRIAVVSSVSNDSGKVTVSWVENDQNNLFLDEGTNTIFVRTLQDGAWSEETVVFEAANEIVDLAAYNGDVYYSVINSDTTHSLYKNKELVYNTAGIISELELTDDSLYFLDASEIKVFNGEEIETTGLSDINDYEIASNGTNKVIVINDGDAYTSELYISKFENGEWTIPVLFSNFGKYIRSYSPIIDNDGSVKVALNAVELKEDDINYEKANLIVAEDSGLFDITVDSFDLKDGDLTPGTTETLVFDVSNTGAMDVMNFKARLVDQNNNVLAEKDYNSEIEVYDTETFEIDYAVPADLVKTDLRLEVITDEVDIDPLDNHDTMVVGGADVEIKNLRVLENEGKVACTITNVGGEAAEAVNIELKDGNTLDSIILSENFESIPAGESRDVVVDLPDYMLVAEDGALNAVDAYVTTASIESDLIGNSDRIVFGTLLDESINGWKLENGAWKYYENGQAKTGWILDGGVWYFLDANGIMQTGWILDGGVWYYLNANGAMATGWIFDGGVWYYLNANGAMATGWIFDAQRWYFLEASGAMFTGWLFQNGAWYYLYNGGEMVIGYKLLDWANGNDLFGFGVDGRMYQNTTTPEGYKADANGVISIDQI